MQWIKYRKVMIVFIVMALSVTVIWSLYQSYAGLMITNYTVECNSFSESVRVVQLTDLHNSEFGDDNKKLISLVQQQEPDLILITGDLLDSGERMITTAVNLITGLSEIAPVYISYGNHEQEYEENYGIDIADLYENAGAAVLEYEYSDIIVNHQSIRMGGVSTYCTPESLLGSEDDHLNERTFLNEFQNTDSYTILLCHYPLCWIYYNGINEWNVDCVFTGHIHGGQIRIPYIGGLYAPDVGFFPGRACGVYYSEQSDRVVILSRGLGSTEKIPRFNNIPEIVVVDIGPKVDDP